MPQANPPVLKRSPLRSALLRKLYQCADGVQVIVLPEKDAVRLTLNGEVYHLSQAPSHGSETKYSQDAVTWTTQGEAGTLQDATDPSNSVVLAKDCRQQSILPPPSASNSLQGTLYFPQPDDPSHTAQVRIALLDLQSAGDSRKSIAATQFRILGRKSPIPFELAFDHENVRSADCCAVYAEILMDGKAQFATSKPVSDMSHPGPVSLQLVPVRRRAAQP